MAKLEIRNPFCIAVGVSSMAEYLPYMRGVFEQAEWNNKADGHKSTLSSYDVFVFNHPKFGTDEKAEEFKNVILNRCVDYLNFLDIDCFGKELVLKNLWLNEMESGISHQRHNHYGSLFSGCIYVDLPVNSSGITLYNPSDRYDRIPTYYNNYNSANSGSWTYYPKEGDIFVWESYLEHSVEKSYFEGVRRSIAFDLLLKDKE